MKREKTKEPQFKSYIELRNTKGLSRLGLLTNHVWHTDPRRLLFLLARYKFVAKMLAGKSKILEVGCGDAFGARIVLQEAGKGTLSAIDYEKAFIKDVTDRMDEEWKFECFKHDIVSAPLNTRFEAAYAIDVLEHVPMEKEQDFLRNIAHFLVPEGVLIIGMPSVQSQAHASEASKKGHVNCKDHKALKHLLSQYFDNVFIFSMNDEVVHTGFYPMASYFWGVASGVKE